MQMVSVVNGWECSRCKEVTWEPTYHVCQDKVAASVIAYLKEMYLVRHSAAVRMKNGDVYAGRVVFSQNDKPYIALADGCLVLPYDDAVAQVWACDRWEDVSQFRPIKATCLGCRQSFEMPYGNLQYFSCVTEPVDGDYLIECADCFERGLLNGLQNV